MKDCIFCKIINGEFSSYKVYEDENVLAFLNINPDAYGHTLLIPKTHYTDYEDIPLDVLNSINEAGKIVYDKLKKGLKPNGIQIVQNNGIVQDIKHYHLHFIPIYSNKKEGSKNFEEVLKKIIGE